MNRVVLNCSNSTMICSISHHRFFYFRSKPPKYWKGAYVRLNSAITKYSITKNVEYSKFRDLLKYLMIFEYWKQILNNSVNNSKIRSLSNTQWNIIYWKQVLEIPLSTQISKMQGWFLIFTTLIEYNTSVICTLA